MKKILKLSKHYHHSSFTWVALGLVLQSFILITNAQNPSVRGTVKDLTGEAIIGANVAIKGTTIGTVTDIGGNFLISNTQSNSILVISYIGYQTKEVSLGGKSQIDIFLEEDAVTLGEVVAIGYGSVKKQDLTGAVATIAGSKIADRKTMKVSQALQGAVSGVRVARSGSAADASAIIRVRGITSINNTDPLVIIDGVPGTLDWVHPDDIESISVLKDAASASIYGSRAAAGVILITTKRAREGVLSIEYNYEYSIDKPTAIPKYANARTYMRILNERNWNDNGNSGDEYSVYSKNYMDNYSQMHVENPDKYPDTNWMDLLMKSTSSRQNHKLNILAGSQNVKTKISMEYEQSDALYRGRNYDRMMFRINNDIILGKYLKAAVDVNGIYSVTEKPGYNFGPASRISAPIYAGIWSDGRLAEGKTGENPYALLMERGSSLSKTGALGGKIALDFTPIEGLTISGVFSPQFYQQKIKDFYKSITYTSLDDPDYVVGNIHGATKTTLTESRPDYLSTTTQAFINYTKAFNEHHLNVMGGFENYYYFNESMSAARDHYALQAFPYLSLGNENYQTNSGSAYQNAYRSWFGRLMYNYKNKYYFQANARYDGSSRFAKDYRWGFFPSFSAGWTISEETFMKNIDWLSSLKLRTSYGTLGNERIGNYPYQSTIGFENTLLYLGGNVTSSQAAGVYKYAIYDISWETTESYNIGLDASFLNNQLRFSGDWYKKTTKDMLLALEIPDYTGLENPDQNTGKMNTKGWEFELGWMDNIGDFTYSLSFNLSDAKSVMGDLGGTEFLGNQVKFKGSEFNEWYGYLSDGIYQTKDEVANSAVLNSNVKPGDIKYIDVSGPDGVPDGKISPEYDRVLLGGSLPRYTYGGNMYMAYKELDLSLTFHGIGKQKVQMTAAMMEPFESEFREVPQIIVGNYWSHYNSEEENLRAKYPRISQTGKSNNQSFSDYWLFSGAYFRLSNICLGYTMPKKITKKVNLQNLRIYANISDPLSFHNYPKGWDPESSGYWITTSFLLGISVKF